MLQRKIDQTIWDWNILYTVKQTFAEFRRNQIRFDALPTDNALDV